MAISVPTSLAGRGAPSIDRSSGVTDTRLKCEKYRQDCRMYVIANIAPNSAENKLPQKAFPRLRDSAAAASSRNLGKTFLAGHSKCTY